MRTLSQINLKGKKALLRVDFNTPLSPDGYVANDARIQQSLPTIQHILNEGGKLIIMSHLGRPKGKHNPKFSLTPCAKHLSFLLQKEVKLAPDCVGPEVEKLVESMQNGEVVMLENLRFHPGEEDPDAHPEFVKSLAKLGDIYINDAFGTAHRKHASTSDIARFFPNKKGIGFLMEKELTLLSQLLLEPNKPFYAIIGGAKIGSKTGVLKSLLSKVDAIFLGGGLAFTFLKAQGVEIGSSIFDANALEDAKHFIASCQEKKIPLYLPQDILIADKVENNAKTRMVTTDEGIPPGWIGVDIGPKTLTEWAPVIETAQTIFWNGPMGVFEIPNFSNGTRGLTKKLAELSSPIIVGGGDSVAAVKMMNAQKNFSHISTGGGASLEYIERGHLPGIDALEDNFS